jgi:hypothetical protein
MSDSDSRNPREFVDEDLRGARFVRSDLSGAVMRAVGLAGADIDTPDLRWIELRVNGVDVVPLVEAELDRRFPGRELRRVTDPAGLQEAWAALERTWATTLDRVSAMSAGTVDVSVDGEWTFAQTLRHLILATNAWLNGAIERVEQPFHPIGQPFAEYESDGFDMSIFMVEAPSFDEVLAVRAAHVAMVRDFIAGTTPEQLAAACSNPWAPEHELSVLRCLHVILNEEWEHHRFAVRDLDSTAATSTTR